MSGTLYTLDDTTPEAIMHRARALAATLMMEAAQHAAREACPADIAGILNDAADAGLLRPDAVAFVLRGEMPPGLVAARRPASSENPKPEAPGDDSVPAGTRRH